MNSSLVAARPLPILASPNRAGRGLSLGLILSIGFAGTVQAATTLNVGVGVGTGTVSGNAYVPGDVTILVGDSIKYTIESDEPHSVTFGNGPAAVPPPEWPAAGVTGTNPPPPAPGALTGTYAGTGHLNTQLMFKGSTATITFTAAGAFPFICIIHPGMAGTVNVVASGATTTQAEADSQGRADPHRAPRGRRRHRGGADGAGHRNAAVERHQPLEHLHQFVPASGPDARRRHRIHGDPAIRAAVARHPGR